MCIVVASPALDAEQGTFCRRWLAGHPFAAVSLVAVLTGRYDKCSFATTTQAMLIRNAPIEGLWKCQPTKK